MTKSLNVCVPAHLCMDLAFAACELTRPPSPRSEGDGHHQFPTVDRGARVFCDDHWVNPSPLASIERNSLLRHRRDRGSAQGLHGRWTVGRELVYERSNAAGRSGSDTSTTGVPKPADDETDDMAFARLRREEAKRLWSG